MKNTITYFICTLFLFVACQKEIDVELNDAAPKLVIEANLVATDSIVKVKVTKTASYFDQYTTNYINDAIVVIKNQQGVETIVPHIADGYYELSNYATEIGTVYTVTVTHEGTAYSSTCKLMPTLELLPARIEYQEPSIFSEEGYWIYYSFQDFQGVGNCYKMIPTYHGKTYDKFGDFSLGEDKFTDGNIVERPLMKTLQLGDTVWLELQSIDKKVYDYYDQLGSNTSSFTASAGNPNYVWTNDALGYFSAYTYVKQQIIVE